jgi:hypothetical protein
VRSYHRAYSLGELRAFPGWQDMAADPDGPDDIVCYIAEDLSVVTDPFGDEPPLLATEDQGWAGFCRSKLGFAVPVA